MIMCYVIAVGLAFGVIDSVAEGVMRFKMEKLLEASVWLCVLGVLLAVMNGMGWL